MTISPKRVLLAQLSGIQAALASVPPAQKSHLVGKALALAFNQILERTAQCYPDLAEHLPKPIEATGAFASMDKANDSYLDLEAFVLQVTELLKLVE
jgi:hypothetical protein